MSIYIMTDAEKYRLTVLKNDVKNLNVALQLGLITNEYYDIEKKAKMQEINYLHLKEL